MTSNQRKIIQIKTEDLPLSCPMLGDDDWDGHPKVFLEVNPKKLDVLIAVQFMK